ncbi:MAG: ATP phosphoribosyltransferase regulatory subunit [Nitrosomonadaceae bacterium]|jgi:ATP phosphoribosyltransferase regulatory subunit|nr:ATP phosphoribosyltransferase regulatory subunit [Nitrosomonadaceae bacterium]
MTTWALPENLEDVLPADARKLERARRIAIDTFASRGYELVVPPLIEYVESLLSGVGKDMDLATFKLVDQLSGRLLGVRADTTPQVARIDAHVLNRSGVARLCYAGSVLHTRPAGLGKSRQPFQVGAELYGAGSLEADIEVQQLLLDTLAAIGVPALRLDVGHPSVFRALVDALDGALPTDALMARREALFAAVVAKDRVALEAALAEVPAAQRAYANALVALPSLYGTDPAKVLALAEQQLPALPAIQAALEQLRQVATHFSASGVAVSIDLGELGGFNYESGIVFAVFARGAAEAVGRGGRYDDIGRAFGRARPATGFSMDLKALLALIEDAAEPAPVMAPRSADPALAEAVAALRASGVSVINQLPGETADALSQLELIDGRWQVVTRK